MCTAAYRGDYPMSLSGGPACRGDKLQHDILIHNHHEMLLRSMVVVMHIMALEHGFSRILILQTKT
jgi:hypothetical protein